MSASSWQDSNSKKKCKDCQQSKPLAEFIANKRTKDGVNVYCRSCDTLRMRKWRSENPERAERNETNSRYKRVYGITLEDYERMFTIQSGVCAVCRQEQLPKGRRLCVDHHHETGRVRGLLCRNCNHVLWLVDSHPDWQTKILAYLTETL